MKNVFLAVMVGMWAMSLCGCSLIGLALSAGAAYGISRAFGK